MRIIPRLLVISLHHSPRAVGGQKMNMDHVFKPVLEMVNFIRTHALNHRQFRNLATELDEDLPGDLHLHCSVKWLSRRNVLSRFFFNFWALLNCFLNRIFGWYSASSQQIESRYAREVRISAWPHLQAHLQKKEFMHFPSLVKACGEVAQASGERGVHYAALIEELQQNFEDRFCNLKLKRPQIRFLISPLHCRSRLFESPLNAFGLCCGSLT